MIVSWPKIHRVRLLQGHPPQQPNLVLCGLVNLAPALELSRRTIGHSMPYSTMLFRPGSNQLRRMCQPTSVMSHK